MKERELVTISVLKYFVRSRSNVLDPTDDQYWGRQGTYEATYNPVWQQWKTVLFVVGKLHRQYEYQYQIVCKIPEHKGLSELHNPTKWARAIYTELLGSKLPI